MALGAATLSEIIHKKLQRGGFAIPVSVKKG